MAMVDVNVPYFKVKKKFSKNNSEYIYGKMGTCISTYPIPLKRGGRFVKKIALATAPRKLLHVTRRPLFTRTRCRYRQTTRPTRAFHGLQWIS